MHMIFLKQYLLAIFCVLGWAKVGVQAQPVPQLRALSQHVVQVGTTVPIQVLAAEHGEAFHRLTFSHPEIVARIQTEPPTAPDQTIQPKYGHFEVAVSPRVAPGIYEVAAIGPAGVSNPLAFVVSNQPVVIPDPAATESNAGFALPVGGLIWDRCRPQQMQRYQISVTEPQSLSIKVEAQALDSNLIPVVILRDGQGVELARSRAVKRLPAAIDYPVLDAGSYWIEVHDFLHQGGPDYFYSLNVELGTAATTTDLIDKLRQPLDLRQRTFRDPTIVPVVGDWATRAGGLDLALAAKPPETATIHQLPIVLSGQFGEPSQPTRIDFQGGAGQGVWCEVVSASAGQLTDPQLLLYRVRRDDAGTETLQLLTHQDDSPGVGTGPVNIASADPAFMATLPEEGQYCVVVMDHITSPRPVESRQFVVSIAAPQPDFQLIAHPVFHNNDPAQARPGGVQVARGGTVAWHVHVLRRQGFVGSVELTLAGLPEGVSATPVVVPPTLSQATIVAQAEGVVTEWSGAERIVGRALGEVQLRRVAWPAAIQQASSARRNFVQWGLVAEQRLRVDAEQEAALGMTWDSSVVPVTPNVPTTAVLNLARREGGNGQCIIRPIQLPPGWAIGEATIPPDQTQATINIQIPAETPAGRYTISFHNETKIQWKPTAAAAAQEQPVWLPVPTLTIEVSPPNPSP
jgi:hypothetical protein